MGISNRASWSAVGATLLLTTPALSQSLPMYTNTNCEPYEQISELLEEKYSEKKLALAWGTVFVIDDHPDNTYPAQGIVSIWTNQDSGSFSITVTFEDTMTCLLTSGVGFEPYTGK